MTKQAERVIAVILSLIILFGFSATQAFATGNGPQIDSLNPYAAIPGYPLTITGSNFMSGPIPGSTAGVYINDILCNVLSWNNYGTEIKITVPPQINQPTALLRIETNDRASNTQVIEVLLSIPPAAINQLVPNQPAGYSVGQELTISGDGFLPQGEVLLDDIAVPVIVNWEMESITIVIPDGYPNGGTVFLVVHTAANVFSNALPIKIAPTVRLPQITSVVPAGSLYPNTSFSVNGTAFGNSPGTICLQSKDGLESSPIDTSNMAWNDTYIDGLKIPLNTVPGEYDLILVNSNVESAPPYPVTIEPLELDINPFLLPNKLMRGTESKDLVVYLFPEPCIPYLFDEPEEIMDKITLMTTSNNGITINSVVGEVIYLGMQDPNQPEEQALFALLVNVTVAPDAPVGGTGFVCVIETINGPPDSYVLPVDIYSGFTPDKAAQGESLSVAVTLTEEDMEMIDIENKSEILDSLFFQTESGTETDDILITDISTDPANSQVILDFTIVPDAEIGRYYFNAPEMGYYIPFDVVLEAPVITQIPVQTQRNEFIAINVENLGTAQGIVHFIDAENDIEITDSNWQNDSVDVTVPLNVAVQDNVKVKLVRRDGYNVSGYINIVEPVITSSPTEAKPEDTITITGSGFRSAGSLQLGALDITDLATWLDTIITVEVPEDVSIGVTTLLITNDLGNSASVPVTIYKLPEITKTVPTIVQIGETITSTGKYFGNRSKLSLNKTEVTPTQWSDTSISAVIPEGMLGPVEVEIETLHGDKVVDNITVVAPEITLISPSPADPGEPVTVVGQYFGSPQSLLLGSTNITGYTWGETSIDFTVPENAPAGSAVVTVTNSLNNSCVYNMVINDVAPVISSIVPNSAQKNQQIEIKG